MCDKHPSVSFAGRRLPSVRKRIDEPGIKKKNRKIFGSCIRFANRFAISMKKQVSVSYPSSVSRISRSNVGR